MAQSERIRAEDISALLRLANELHELAPNPVVRHEHMLRSLGKVLGAQVGVSLIGRAGPSSSPERFDLCMLVYHGWTDARQRAAANEYFRTMMPANPVRPSLVKRSLRETPATYRREQLVADDEWYRSRYVQERHRAMGVDHAMYSVASIDRSRLMTGIAVYREERDTRRFTDRERVLLRMFHSQAQWLYDSEPITSGPNSASPLQIVLSPRQKQTLRLLLGGDAEKQIAIKLSLSRHTVHEHVKAIYRSIGVSSRGELLAKFLHRG
jgi:DNA-binding CsgD family transcriptional regulator